LRDYAYRGSISITIIPQGSIITIAQVDLENHKVIGPYLSDWHHWDMPVEPERNGRKHEPL
jgi:hypothetical protein